MKFKTGDKVRFLNQTGGGVITRMINDFMASVAIDDGFEIPTLTSELVIIEDEARNSRLFRTETSERPVEISKPKEKIVVVAAPEPEFEPSTPIRLRKTQQTVNDGVYLLFMPINQEYRVAGDIQIFIANHTSYDVLFSVFARNRESVLTGIDYGSVEPHYKYSVAVVNRDDIADWLSGFVQMQFFSYEPEKVVLPVNVSFKARGSQFYSEHSFAENALLGGSKALQMNLVQTIELQSVEDQEKGDVKKKNVVNVASKNFEPESLIDKHRTQGNEAEVDLHISALREKYDNLSPHEILNIQVRYFENALESAMLKGYRKVVFIHGIGNGALKQAITNRLNDYENISVQAASFAKYGAGALEVNLR